MKFAKCSVQDCQQRNGTMFQFPKDREKLTQWVKFCGQSENWSPNTASRICYRHFESSCIHSNTKYPRLIKNSVPSIKSSASIQSKNLTSHKTYLINEENSPYVVELNYEPSNDEIFDKKLEDYDALVESKNPAVPLTDFQKIKAQNVKLSEENVLLKKRLRLLERKKRAEAVFKRKVKIQFLTNYQNQLVYRNKSSGKMWDKATLKRAIEMRAACGARGYNYLRSLGMPCPSIRFMNKKLAPLKFSPGILDDYLECLKQISIKENDRRAGLFLDEMSIVPANELDPSTHLIIGKPTFPGDKYDMATHALVFLLCGLRRRWKQLVAYYFTGIDFTFFIRKSKTV